jgi:hypothetical protein
MKAACLAGALMWANASAAQPLVSSLQDLKAPEVVNSMVTVTDATGHLFRGTIVDASESSLTLQVKNGIHRFDASDIRSVLMQKEDSVANGALIGAAVAGGLTSLIFLDNECRDDPVCYQALAAYAGLGALSGLVVDALIHRHVVVYTGTTPGAPHRISIVPVIGRTRRGMEVIIGF